MKKLSAVLTLLTLLTGCGQNPQITDSPPLNSDTATVSAEEKDMGEGVATTPALSTTAASYVDIQPTTAAARESSAISAAEPVSTAEAAETPTEAQSTPDTTQAHKPPQTATSAAITTRQTVTTVTTAKAVMQTAPTATTVIATEPPTEPKTVLPNDGTDYGKAKAVYEYMRQNGYGTCVNYACQTYELCRDNGLDCYLVWTNAGMYGHVANIVKVDGIWYVLDTNGGYFLDYNYCFTEVVDTDGNHIADSSIISSYSYDELH